MFVVIEGIDGSGKGTVTQEVSNKLAEQGIQNDTISFPRYKDTLYGGLVGRYLNGEFGDSTHTYLHSTLYALDRFESKEYLKAAIQFNDVMLSDRYIPSNLCYASMSVEKEERDEVLKHFVQLEYGIFGMPVPDVIFFLDMPVKFAVQNIAKKAARSYTDDAADLHERNEQLLSRVRSFYASRLMDYHPPTRFEAINCERNGHMRPIEKIVDQVFESVLQLRKVS